MKKRNFPEDISKYNLWESLYNCYRSNIPVVGTIIKYNERIGYTVDVDGIHADMPRYEISYAYIADFESYVGKTFLFTISNIDTYCHSLKVTRKRLASSLKAGMTANGVITEIIGNRMHIDVGFLARVNIKDMADFFVKDINDIFQEGQFVDITLLEDYNSEKYTEATSKASVIWKARREALNINAILNVSVVEIIEVGLIVNISNYHDGFIHKNYLTECLKKRFDSNSIKVGETIEAAVSGINDDERKVFLSTLQVEKIKKDIAWKEFLYDVSKDKILSGVIETVTETRIVVVRFNEFVSGYIPYGQLSGRLQGYIKSGISLIGKSVEAAVVSYSASKYKLHLSMSRIAELNQIKEWEENLSDVAIDDILKGIISNVDTNSLSVKLGKYIDCHVTFPYLSNEYKKRITTGDSVLGEEIYVAVTKVDHNKHKLQVSMRRVEELSQIKAEYDLKSKIEKGEKLPAVVLEVQRKFAIVQIEGTNVNVHIDREELSVNKIVDATSEVYPGQTINVVYLGEEEGKMLFSRRSLTTPIYSPDLYNLSLTELLAKQGIDKNLFIGRAVKVGEDIFFHDIASVGSKFDGENFFEGRLLQDIITAQPSIVLVHDKKCAKELTENSFYQFSIALAPKQIRTTQGSPFIYQTASDFSIEPIENPYKKEVDRVFSKQDSPESNKIIASLLREVGSQLYSEKSRMLFELLQNADDAAPSREQIEEETSPMVQVGIDIVEDGIIFRHNGCAFNFEDFRSITSAANSTKGVKKKSTGYKGIGFKSVFTNSQSVFIHSKGFQFWFDRNNPIFDISKFDELYCKVRNISSDEEAKKFFSKYAETRLQYNGIEDIPWQIMPFWHDSASDILPTTDAPRDNVIIGLMMDASSIAEYRAAIQEVFDNPRMFLFLRHTHRLQFNSDGSSRPQTIQKRCDLSTQIITLAHSKSSSAPETYKLFNATNIEISDSAFDKAGIGIKIKCEEKDGIKRYSFLEISDGIEGKKVSNIPDKIASADSTSISLAFAIDENGEILPINCEGAQSSFYAYLPMNEQRFKFPFFVNADFVLSSSREGLQTDNRWNIFLFHKIGALVVEAVQSVANVSNRKYLNLLPDLLTTNYAATSTISEAFNKSYLEALNTQKFILDENEILRSQGEIIIDKTELSKVIGNAFFRSITDSAKFLPNDNLDIHSLYRECFDQIEITDFKDISQALASTKSATILNEWLHRADTDKETDLDFYDWLIKHQDKLDVQDIITNLEIFKVGNSFVSLSQVISDEILILSKEAFEMADLLTKLNIRCNTCDISGHKLIDFIPVSDNSDVFKALGKTNLSILDFSERLRLFKTLKFLNGIGEVKLKEISLFKNTERNPKPLKDMVAFREDAPSWIMPYMICEEDLTDELRPYLVPLEREFSDIIWKNLDNIDIPIYEIYKVYRWSDQEYTKILISKCISQEDFEALLPIVVESSQDVKKEYIRSIKRVDLNTGNKYYKDSFEHKILKLVLEGEESPSIFAHKVYFDNKPITKFSIKNDVICEWEENGNKKMVTFSLAKILPEYADQSSTIDIIKDLFEVKSGLDRFFEAKAKPNKEIYDELNTKYNLYNGEPWPIDKTDNVYQYLFHIYYTKVARGYTSSYVKSIDLEKVNSIFIIRLMNFCFENNLNIRTAPFTFRVKQFFVNKYFGNNYLTDGEKLLSTIEEWANSDEKRHKYLRENGVKDGNAKEIRFRRMLNENQRIDDIEDLTTSDINNGLSFICSNLNLTFPLVGDNQVETIKILSEKAGVNIKRNINLVELSSLSREWDSSEYTSWIQNHYIHIYLYEGNMPYFLDYGNIHICKIASDKDYHYEPSSKKLYINSEVELTPLLFSLVTQQGIPFDTNDYRILCMEGKVSISKDEIAAKNEEIESLKSRVEELERLLNGRSVHIGGTSTGLSKKDQYAALIEAQQALKSKRPDWSFPIGFGERNDDGTPACFTVETVQNEEGNNMEIVIKSYKKTDERFHINPEEWEAVVKRRAKLLVYTYFKGELDIVEIPKDELVRKQSSIQISFDTSNLDEEKYPDKISEFASILRYFQQITFDFNQFHISKDAVKVKDISSKRDLIITSAEDEDI